VDTANTVIPYPSIGRAKVPVIIVLGAPGKYSPVRPPDWLKFDNVIAVPDAVAVPAFEDLSFHEVTVDPDVVIVDASVASNHN
jgi:hypothetical protein